MALELVGLVEGELSIEGDSDEAFVKLEEYLVHVDAGVQTTPG